MGLKHHTLENTIKQSHFNQVGLVKLRTYVLESSKKHETLAQTKERMRACVCVNVKPLQFRSPNFFRI